MNTTPMSNAHQAGEPWLWSLEAGAATTLAEQTQPRWLVVNQGRVWVTRRDSPAGVGADDIWLQAGQSLSLPAGTAWVIEAWPQARLSLLAPAPQAVKRGVAPGALTPIWRRLAWLSPSLLAS